MKMPDNTIASAANYFNDELNHLFDESELKQQWHILVDVYFGISKSDLLLDNDKQLSESDLLKIIYAVKALKVNKPLAYVLGQWEFYGINFMVNEHTLVPRQETEELVDLILKENKETNISVLDIGTGSGCIAIALKKNGLYKNVSAYDISKEALNTAKQNSEVNEVEVSFNVVDILLWEKADLECKVDVIVSNPPYITITEKELMHDNVLDYEPHLALFVADKEPLIFYEAIADFGLEKLINNGKIYFEINEQFGAEVKSLLIDKGYKNVNIVKDINDKDRIVSCNL